MARGRGHVHDAEALVGERHERLVDVDRADGVDLDDLGDVAHLRAQPGGVHDRHDSAHLGGVVRHRLDRRPVGHVAGRRLALDAQGAQLLGGGVEPLLDDVADEHGALGDR